MTLLKGKHLIVEFGEELIRGTVVEKGASEERVSFLKDLLEFNGLEVLTKEDKKKTEEDPTTFTVGVTDIVFNPVIAVYQRLLKTKEGHRVTADYWNQKTTEAEPNYWDLGKKNF
ncbi:MAG TPA: hypothetical protein EYQ86_04905 [Bacteroidetes bacterium]|nr:hypothetical protein [Bacteroidota bacterium]